MRGSTTIISRVHAASATRAAIDFQGQHTVLSFPPRLADNVRAAIDGGHKHRLTVMCEWLPVPGDQMRLKAKPLSLEAVGEVVQLATGAELLALLEPHAAEMEAVALRMTAERAEDAEDAT